MDFSSYARTGIKGGTVFELLDGRYSPVSKLVWKTPASLDFGFRENISLSHFICNTGVNFSMPNKWGTMKDYDYFMSGAVCQYSMHSNHLESDYTLFLDSGYRFDIKKISIVPLAGILYQHRKFSAWDGYLQIPEAGKAWNGDEEKQEVSGNGISYEQNILLPFVKLKIGCDFYKNFLFSGSIKFSPWFFAECTDTHYFRNKQFTDIMNGGFCIGAEGRIFYKKIGIVMSYEYIKSSKNAKTYSQDIGTAGSERKLSNNYIPGIESGIWLVGVEYKL